MAKMQRPCWTIAFGIICVLVVPGAVLTHMSVAELIPTISDLPQNVVKGFQEVFKFAHLKMDSADVKASSDTVLKACNIADAALFCPTAKSNSTNTNINQKKVSTKTAKAAIQKAFASSLSVVSKIANDKYLGTADLKNTADNLNKITAEMNKIAPSMKCYAAVPAFCGIYLSADGIVAGIAEVDKAINEFKTSDVIKQFEDNTALLTFLHALPYLLVVALLFFAIFWCRGGVCCCCRGGTKCGTLALIPSILFWLVSFVIYAIVLATGIMVKFMADKIPVPVLKGEPSLDVAIDHIKTNFPKFWNVVFADMEDSLDKLLLASYFFVAACLLQSMYSCCEVCCCPYRAKAEKAENQPAADTKSPGAPGLLNPAAAKAAETKPDVEQPAEKTEVDKPAETAPVEEAPAAVV